MDDEKPTRPMARRKRWYVGAGVLLLALLVGGSARYYYTRFVPRHLQTVAPGVLYRSSWPTADQFGTVVSRYGIRTVVNLCLPGEELSQLDGNWQREEEQCRKLGVAVVHFPLPGNTHPNPEQVAEWLQLFKTPERLPVLVHCAQGVIRTNGLVAIFRIGVQGEDNEEVLHSLPDFGHDLFSPKRQKLNDFILAWRPDSQSRNPSAGTVAAGTGTGTRQ